MISYLWAESKGHIIGINGNLPWKLPADMHYFKQITTNNIILAGTNTYKSFGRPLPNRLNIVLTHQKEINFPDEVMVMHDVNDFLKFANDNKDKEIFVVGGAQIFKLLLPYVDRLYCTFIDHEFDGDTTMPEINYEDFSLVKETPGKIDSKNIYPYKFDIFERK